MAMGKATHERFIKELMDVKEMKKLFLHQFDMYEKGIL
jgi:hypothetical protein